MTSGAEKPNLYWPVYRNLEKEVLALADEIHFCDNQLDVYSIKIAELLLRISAEIESLFKDLYRAEERKEPEETGVAVKFLTERWKLDKKIVMISAPNMYFTEEQNRIFSPLGYVKGDDNDYYKAYNAVKHNRVKDISKANIRVLIRALAALYLLNIYYRNDKFAPNMNFDPSLGSNVFNVRADPYGLCLGSKIVCGARDDCVYLHKYSDYHYAHYLKKLNEETDKQKMAFLTSEELRKYSEAGKKFSSQDFHTVISEVGEWNLMNEMSSLSDYEERKNYLLNSSSYKQFIKRYNFGEEITPENIEKTIRLIGSWNFKDRIAPTHLEHDFARTAERETTLNKQQTIYPN